MESIDWVAVARKIRPIIEEAMQSAPDEKAASVAFLFPHWKSGVDYEVGFRVQHKSVLYSVLQPHTSQDTWTPDVAPSLFAKVLIPDENVIPEWEQPNSTNGYRKGDRVMFEGVIYESLIDDNIWSPSVYPDGWKAVSISND